MQREPPGSEVTEVFEADDGGDRDDQGDLTVPLRTAGADTALQPDRAPGPEQAAEPEHVPESEPAPEPDLAAEREHAPERHHAPGRVPGGLFGAITVVPALLATAWLLPSLPLLLTGRLAALPLAFMFSPLAVGLCYFALRQRPAAWPGYGRPGKPVPWWSVAATVAVAAGFAVWQIAALVASTEQPVTNERSILSSLNGNSRRLDRDE